MADVASYCTFCGAKIEPSSKFCSNCGKATSTAAAQEKTASGAGGGGGGIVKDVGGGRVAGIAEKRASAAWYLLPIFLWFIGGLIMFFVLKDEDRGRAKGGLKLGIITVRNRIRTLDADSCSYCSHSSSNIIVLLSLIEGADCA